MTLPAWIESISLQNELGQILVSLLIGLLIGGEREYHNKSAGLRTFILISFGACLCTILSIKIGGSSPDRIAANIITGIGFLGAGAIFKDENKVSGITTASTIWATASLGMCVGSGHTVLAIFGAVLVWFVLYVMASLQNWIDQYNKIIDYKLTLPTINDVSYCEDLFHQYGLKPTLLREAKSPQQCVLTWRLAGRYSQHQAFLAKLRQDAVIQNYQY